MPYIAQYIIKLSISIGIVYLFYALVLRRLTFYNWNRWYLLGYSILAFLIPFINISPVLEKSSWTDSYMIQLVPVIGAYTAANAPEQTTAELLWKSGAVILCVGVLLLLLRLLVQYISYLRVKKTAALLSDDAVKVYQVDKNIVPFSFGNSIFINQQQYNEHELREIIRHEFIHVKQRHTMDVLWGELLCVLNWYNPFAWLIRRSIRQNLEFIADHQVLEAGLDRKQYQYMLLKVVGGSAFAIASPFNFSALKKRIAMMNKMRSAKVHAIKFMFALPLLIVLLLAFRNVVTDVVYGNQDKTAIAGIVVDAATMEPLNDVVIKVPGTEIEVVTDKNGYYAITLPEGTSSAILKELSISKDGYEQMVSTGNYRSSGAVPAKLIEFVGMGRLNASAKSDGSFVNSSLIRSQEKGITGYEAVLAVFEKMKSNIIADRQLRALVEVSDKPYWMSNGKSYVFSGQGSSANVDELTDIVMVDGKRMTGAAVNAAISRSMVIGVGAIEKNDAQRKYGIDQAVLELFIHTRPATMRDTVPGKTDSVRTITLKLSNKKVAADSMFVMDASLEGPGNPNKNIMVRPVLRFSNGTTQNPLLIVDGKEMPSGGLNTIAPDNINSITILKDATAIEKYGDRARDGVIIVELKDKNAPVAPPVQLRGVPGKPVAPTAPPVPGATPLAPVRVSVRDGRLSGPAPLYVVEGKEYDGGDSAQMHQMNLDGVLPDNIESIDILKDKSATELYGEKGRNGVIIITLKKKNVITKALDLKLVPNNERPAETKRFTLQLATVPATPVMYVAVENLLKVEAGNIPFEQLNVEFDKGTIRKKNGLLYAVPSSTGTGTVKVFQTRENNTPVLLNTLQYTLKYLPPPSAMNLDKRSAR